MCQTIVTKTHYQCGCTQITSTHAECEWMKNSKARSAAAILSHPMDTIEVAVEESEVCLNCEHKQ